VRLFRQSCFRVIWSDDGKVTVRPQSAFVDIDNMFDRIMAAQQQLVLVRQLDGAFRIAGERPVWFAEVHPAAAEMDAPFVLVEVFPFLELFTADAEPVWLGELDGTVESDMWVETTQAGVPVHLRALALQVDGTDLLAIQPMDRIYRRIQETMQRGRNELIEYQRKDREYDYKETMLHCLVHDLVGSLSVAEVVFRTMQERQDLTADESDSLVVGRNAMHSVSNQLRSMVDVFSAELKAVDFYETDPDFAPDILDCAMLELVSCSPAFRNKDITIENVMPEDAALRWPVVGEQDKLQRIIFNFLENALRYSPRGGKIRLVVSGDEERARLAVEDQGAGVPGKMATKVFSRFAKDKRGGGKGGLGLYFARLMIERWGGSIGHERPEEGGARFWFELPRAKESD
jgi:signal transduction histidine kinase